jgi:hypothetical protein
MYEKKEEDSKPKQAEEISESDGSDLDPNEI